MVVDKAPDDPRARETVDAAGRGVFAGRRTPLRLVQCPFPGRSFARNAGIAQPCGLLVSFLDDDAVARPNWLAEIWRAFERHPDAGVIGGTIVPLLRDRWSERAR